MEMTDARRGVGVLRLGAARGVPHVSLSRITETLKAAEEKLRAQSLFIEKGNPHMGFL
jgi:hypothetical protein